MTNNIETSLLAGCAPEIPVTSWRDRLPIHDAAKEFTVPTPAELKKLADDIAANGLQNKAKTQWRGGEQVLLDGRSRLDALELNGVTIDFNDPSIFEVIPETVDPVTYIISANVLRRHLTSEQRQDILIKLIAREPEKSDRQIGKEAGVDHKTVAKARAKGRDVGSIPHVTKRIDSKGRKQSATKVRKPATKIEASLPLNASPPLQAPSALPPPITPSSVMVGDNLDPKASAAARKAVYAATELQPAELTNNYAANRVTSGERHPGLTGALRKAVLAVEASDSTAAIVRSFKEFVALARTLGVHLDCIDVCARRVLQ
jgi:hypothetical protein